MRPAHIKSLEKRIRDIEEQNEILKKATALFQFVGWELYFVIRWSLYNPVVKGKLNMSKVKLKVEIGDLRPIVK